MISLDINQYHYEIKNRRLYSAHPLVGMSGRGIPSIRAEILNICKSKAAINQALKQSTEDRLAALGALLTMFEQHEAHWIYGGNRNV